MDSNAVDALLQQFWIDESIPGSSTSTLTEEELQCERHFAATHEQDAYDKYIVRLLFKCSLPSLSTTLFMYAKLERQFLGQAKLARQYHAFLAMNP